MNSVKLISYTQAYDKNLGDSLQDIIAYTARVSNPSNQSNTKTSSKLINYLIDHKHWSPFEMANVCLEIVTTRDIARQILRHRSFSFQEFSQRYAEATEYTYRETRLQDKKNRQNSIENDDKSLAKRWIAKQQQIIHECSLAYSWALENGIAKEQARCVLPEGNTMSRMYVNGTLRSWIHYCQVRIQKDTQKEHRLIAEMCVDEISKVFPIIKQVVKENNDDNKNNLNLGNT